jgi:DNA-binding transcriptional MocR family regulator
MDAIDRLATSLVRLGDPVVVENPSFPPLLDLLEQLGATVIGVPVDDEGMLPASLREALKSSPVALFTMPRAHNPLGVSTTERRAAELAAVLARSAAVIVEDDHSGDIATAPLASLGVHLPQRTVLIRSYSKSHGPDLRLAAVGGAAEPINRMAQRRILGPGWSSRLLQAVLTELLVDETAVQAVEAARHEYARRRQGLSDALVARGIDVTGTDGINLWVEVPDERSAQVGLAARQIGVAPGTPFLVDPLDSDHLRLTVGLVRDGFEALADQVLAAVGGPTAGLMTGSRR